MKYFLKIRMRTRNTNFGICNMHCVYAYEIRGKLKLCGRSFLSKKIERGYIRISDREKKR